MFVEVGDGRTVDADSAAARAVSRHRLAFAVHQRCIRVRWTRAQARAVGAALVSSDWHGIADRRKTSLRTLWKQLAIVAEKAGRASPLDLVDGLLREAALAELDSGLLVVSMFRPDAARARRPRELLTALAAARLEIGIRRVAGLATLTAAQTTVLRLAVAGLDRDAIAELLGRSRKTVDNHCRGLCQACGVTRLEHATHDVLRVACGFRISRGKSR